MRACAYIYTHTHDNMIVLRYKKNKKNFFLKNPRRGTLYNIIFIRCGAKLSLHGYVVARIRIFPLFNPLRVHRADSNNNNNTFYSFRIVPGRSACAKYKNINPFLQPSVNPLPDT